MDIIKAKQLFGKYFFGPEELTSIADRMPIQSLARVKIPKIQFSDALLKKSSKDFILILGVKNDCDNKPLTLVQFRELLGFDPVATEPCMYNQDWYLKQKFANKTTLKLQWYLIARNLVKETRGKTVIELQKQFKKMKWPSAILTAYTFFANYFLNKDVLWKNDFVWCSDVDNNGDQIYTGRYQDPKKIQKNGFNIHRHLKIRSWYGVAPEL
jgi:hypothetical protein